MVAFDKNSGESAEINGDTMTPFVEVKRQNKPK
jgi:hypothetical protein